MSINLAEYTVLTPESAALAKILESERLGFDGASCSTTEAVMVALALCDRRYLPADLRDEHVRALRARLDASQKSAVGMYLIDAIAKDLDEAS